MGSTPEIKEDEEKIRGFKVEKGEQNKEFRKSVFFKENDSVQQVSELMSEEDNEVNESKMVKVKDLKRTSKTKFEEYLEMEMPNSDLLAQEDLELERKLAKKLKVKGSKLRGDDDGLNVLFEGFSDEEDVDRPLSKKRKKKKSVQLVVKDYITDDSISEPFEGECANMAAEEIPANAPSRKRRRKRKSLLQGKEGDMVGETALGLSQPSECHDIEVALDESSSKAPAIEGIGKYVAPYLRIEILCKK